MDSLAQTSFNNPVEIFCFFDELTKLLFPHLSCGVGRKRTLNVSEIATITVLRSRYGIVQLKQLHRLLCDKFSTEFELPCYKNFVETINTYTPELLLMIQLLLWVRNNDAGVIKLTDSTSIPVCKNIRIPSHKVMKRLATRSKSTMGWFYGLKLHVVTDEYGNLLKFMFTTGNVDDRKALDKFLDMLKNSLVIADAGYISKKLEKKARENNNMLITCMRNTMKKLSTPLHIFLLNKRINVEHLFSILKERFGLITSLPRSELGFLAHYVRTIFAYLFMPAIS